MMKKKKKTVLHPDPTVKYILMSKEYMNGIRRWIEKGDIGMCARRVGISNALAARIMAGEANCIQFVQMIIEKAEANMKIFERGKLLAEKEMEISKPTTLDNFNRANREVYAVYHGSTVGSFSKLFVDKTDAIDYCTAKPGHLFQNVPLFFPRGEAVVIAK